MRISERFTDEQLSLILGEHADGNLVRYGSPAWPRFGRGCIVQVAQNSTLVDRTDPVTAWIVTEFDVNYDPKWRTKDLVRFLDRDLDQEVP